MVSVTHPTHQVYMGVSAMEEAMASALEILKADKFRGAEVHAPKRIRRQSASLARCIANMNLTPDSTIEE